MTAPISIASARHNKIEGVTSLPEYIASVQRGDYRTQVAAVRAAQDKTARARAKQQLPAVMPCGTFNRRANDALETYSGIIVADLDKIGPDAVEDAHDRARADKHCLAAHVSPSGDGLKLFFAGQPDAARHRENFDAVCRHVKAHYGLDLDQSGKDIARLCFASYDRAAWCKEAEPLPEETATIVATETQAAPVAESNVQVTSQNATIEPNRRTIAERILGPIQWQDAATGFCRCPGEHMHTTGDGKRDCRVTLDRAPTLHCFHNSCAGIVAGVNHQLRAEIGKAEWKPSQPGQLESDSSSPETVEPPKPSIADILKARRFNIHTPPPKRAPVYYIGDVPISTAGNLTAIAAKIKSGKSSFIEACIAAAMCGDTERDCLGVVSANPDGRALIHIDTEQSEEDFHDLGRRAINRAGLVEPPPWVHSYRFTGLSVPECNLALAEAMQQHASEHGGLHSVLIDGTADFVSSVNEESECNALVTKLHGMSDKFKCPLVNVIHFNPSGEKTRGHLGSQLERKAETNLRLDKEADGSIVVWSEKNRKAPITKANGPRFIWSDEHHMHVSAASVGAAKLDAEIDQWRDEAAEVFSRANKPAMRWSEITEGIKQVARLKDPGARKHFEKMKKLGVIKKDVLGFYVMERQP
jgi:hypothetical protein